MDLLRDPNQLKNQQTGQSQAPQEQQEKEPTTLIQKAFKGCKGWTYFCGIWTALGVVANICFGNFSGILDGILQMIGFWIFGVVICFTVYPWISSLFHRSTKASEQFWNQKY